MLDIVPCKYRGCIILISEGRKFCSLQHLDTIIFHAMYKLLISDIYGISQFKLKRENERFLYSVNAIYVLNSLLVLGKEKKGSFPI